MLNLREFDHSITETIERTTSVTPNTIHEHKQRLSRLLVDQRHRAEEFVAWVTEQQYFRKRPVRKFVLWLLVNQIKQGLENLYIAEVALEDRIGLADQ